MIVAMLLAAVLTTPRDEFFIVSSVDVAHARVVVKRPTDVTVLLSIPPSAVLRGEHGEALKLGDLRSGDTVYAVHDNGVASSIRRGPMTMDELRKRYLPQLPR
jgi:hypothetical protein